MREPLYNQRFDDIYFSPEDGLAETRHVFLGGNNLPERWRGRDHFTIAETGFGTGLNFLAAWVLFEETALPDAVLDYVSFELYPLAPDVIRQALSGWQTALGHRLDVFLSHYPLRVAGFHRLQISERVRVTLVFDDVNVALPQLEVPRGVDAWFLDGFAPSKNPQMWNENLYARMARLSAPDATAATFTVAGHVRRGLDSAGFESQKVRGFGRKKEMTVARFAGAKQGQEQVPTSPQRVAVIGGGLAGTSCAYVLGRQGLDVTLFEKSDDLAAGASGNVRGLYNPRFTALRGPESGFYAPCYAQAVRTFRHLSQNDDIAFDPCGALHLVTGPEKEKRFRSLCENWGWHDDHMRYLGAAEASDIAGVTVDHDALYLPDSGMVSPRALCRAYAQDADVRLSSPADRLEPGRVNGMDFDAVVIANAAAVKEFAPLSWLPVHTVRGQVSTVKATKASEQLKCNLCYGGYLTLALDGVHMLGSTFQKWLDDTDVKDEDHQENLEKLAAAVPVLGEGLTVSGGRAALRTASQDHVPLIGAARDADGHIIAGCYVSAAHGSHGILSALGGAHVLADLMTGAPRSLPQHTARQLDSMRFIERARRKGQA